MQWRPGNRWGFCRHAPEDRFDDAPKRPRRGELRYLFAVDGKYVAPAAWDGWDRVSGERDWRTRRGRTVARRPARRMADLPADEVSATGPEGDGDREGEGPRK